MWIAVAAIVLLLTTLFIGQTTIQFNPFKIKVERGLKALGYGLILIGALLLESSSYYAGGEDMLNRVKGIVKELKKS